MARGGKMLCRVRVEVKASKVLDLLNTLRETPGKRPNVKAGQSKTENHGKIEAQNNPGDGGGTLTLAVEGSKQLYAILGMPYMVGIRPYTALVANLPDLSANSRRSCRDVVRNRGARDTEGQHQGMSGQLGGDRNEAFSGGKDDRQSVYGTKTKRCK
ncbi:hypothetical protein FB451DRAFT_1179933 [Mycena latifolia]|nr:hypothetical protein FB451DRAFT_1179933 [Mycena latifolia]